MSGGYSSFLTGLSGLASLASFGLLPVWTEERGFDDGKTPEERALLLAMAAGKTQVDQLKDPLAGFKAGLETVAEGGTGGLNSPLRGVPWWVYAGAAGALFMVLKKR